MKRSKPAWFKLMSMTLIIAIIFSQFSGIVVVEAAAYTSIEFQRVRVETLSGPKTTDKLIIYGNGFDKPKVKAGTIGQIPLEINTSLSNPDMIIIDDQQSLEQIIGYPNTIDVFNNNGMEKLGASIQFDLSSIATVKNVSKSKVYVNDPLELEGDFFAGLNNTRDKLYIAGTNYKLGTEAIYNAALNKIEIAKTKAPLKFGKSNIEILQDLKGDSTQVIKTTYLNSISVVDRLVGIEIERIDPNTGPMTKNNTVSIYGKAGKANFSDTMKIYVNGVQGVNKKVIEDKDAKVIGLSVELPTSSVAGAADILLTNSDGSSEFLIPKGFIYLQIGNTLSIDTDGINPAFKKETEDKEVTISGRNIGYLDWTGYEKVNIPSTIGNLLGYVAHPAIPQTDNTNTYKVQYIGTYDGKAITVIRQISVFVEGEAKLVAGKDPTFSEGKDTIIIKPLNVNLDPNEPKAVDVTIKTSTIIYDNSTKAIYYTRNEEYTTKNGFTYIPNEVAPTITSVTPEYGPDDRDILMTIKGRDFQVLEDGSLPTVSIGNRLVKGAGKILVYDDQNRLVDGKKLSLGTKIKLVLPKNTATPISSGAMNVIVKNPSGGQYSFKNGYEFRNPAPTDKVPRMFTIKEQYADLRGGKVSGENVQITGENILTALEGNHRVIITIDGEKAEIVGKVSADGKTVTIIPPPGTVEGKTRLQLINEDGTMTEDTFEYRRVLTAPKITKLVPTMGSDGTLLVIKGEDFLMPDLGAAPDDPKRKGTVVLLNGKELNVYNYIYNSTQKVHSITDLPDDAPDTGIYYNDGTIDGERVNVWDSTTIYVRIPRRFYELDETSTTPPYLKSMNIPLGGLQVQVLNPDGAKSKENVKFTYMEPGTSPTITSVTPSNGSVNGGTIVTILGTGFKESMLKVYFGSEEAAEVEFVNSATLKAKVPIYPYDIPNGEDRVIVPVMVMNYDGAMAIGKFGFEYRIPGSSPVITSLSPSKGSAAGGEEIVIRGRDFRRTGDNSGMPKVYFNGIESPEVKWVGSGLVSETLVVKAPPSKVDGPVDVIIVNYDSGAYTFKSYSYEKSKPTITAVTPGSIGKMGGTKVQINGTNFKKSDYSLLLNGERVDRHLGDGSGKPAASQVDTLVMFGDVTSGDQKVIDTILGPYFTVMNDIRVDYIPVDINNVSVKLSKASDPTQTAIRPVTIIPIGSAHMFVVNGKADLGDASIGDEGILVEAAADQIVVTRRISTNARWENDGLQITAVAPAVASINNRKLYVKNQDGGIASTTINVMNPASNPTITYISPRNRVKLADGSIVEYGKESDNDVEYYTYTPVDGGAFITITGTDFRRNLKVYMGNQLLEVVSRSLNDDQLVVKVPKGTLADLDKLYRIMVVNEDGASADSSTLSKPHYIVYKLPQSNPIIENVTPASTSSKGENNVRIIGNDFRPGAKVYIDGLESSSVSVITYKELLVKIPLGLTPGKKTIQIMNPDFGFGEKKDCITIISSPQIDTVYDIAKNRAISPILFSVDGGQKVALNGRDFMDGIKVIIGGTLKPKSELKEGETGLACYNINDAEMVIVGGVEAADVKIESSIRLTFTTPKLKVGEVSIIVLNSDGGVSNVLNGSYQKPYPDAPAGLTVEVVDSDTIKLEWTEVPETRHYEIYAAVGYNSTNYMYVGSVKAYEFAADRLRYYIDGLKPSTWYSFKLKSVNVYGASTLSYSTAFVKTKDKKLITYYQAVGDFLSGLAQNDRIATEGSGLAYIAGEKSLSNYGVGLVVYFNQASYNSYNPKSIDIAIELLKKYPNNNITVNEKDLTIKMLSSNLLVNETRNVATIKLPDSKMSVVVNTQLKSKGDEIKLKVPRGYKAVTSPVGIHVLLQVEKSKTNIKNLSGTADISYTVSNATKSKYAGGIYIAYYNSTTKKLDILQTQITGNTATAKTNKPGEYMLIGKLTK